MIINKLRDGLISTQYSSFRGNNSNLTPLKTLGNSKSKPKFDLNKKSLDASNDNNENIFSNKYKNIEEIGRSSSSFINHKDNLLILYNKNLINNDQK